MIEIGTYTIYKDGRRATEYTIKNKNGDSITITDEGAKIIRVNIQDNAKQTVAYNTIGSIDNYSNSEELYRCQSTTKNSLELYSDKGNYSLMFTFNDDSELKVTRIEK